MKRLNFVNSPIKEEELLFLDGSETVKSYVVLARRGDIFLGIKLTGLIDGTVLGLPGKTYLHTRVRSARDPALAEQLGEGNVVSLVYQNLTPASAWSGFTFQKVDGKRASVVVGLFVGASLRDELPAVISRIKEGGLVAKLVDYVIETAGPQYCIAPTDLLTAWMSDQLKLELDCAKKAIALHEAAQATQKEFEAVIEKQLEVAGAFGQQLSALFHKHKEAEAIGGIGPAD